MHHASRRSVFYNLVTEEISDTTLSSHSWTLVDGTPTPNVNQRVMPLNIKPTISNITHPSDFLAPALAVLRAGSSFFPSHDSLYDRPKLSPRQSSSNVWLRKRFQAPN
ncbi:unnamed protein product [Cercospora beticola]|nr:unnamed protein product [Cercospora beticola]